MLGRERSILVCDTPTSTSVIANEMPQGMQCSNPSPMIFRRYFRKVWEMDRRATLAMTHVVAFILTTSKPTEAPF